MLLSGNDWEQQVAKAIASFDCGIDDFFGEQHRLAGGYATQNRQGIQVFHPLVTLAAGIVIVGPRNYENHAQVAEAASLAKSEAKKKLAGSGYFIEPRNRAEMHKE
jgi:hypothetical protein